MNPLLDILIHRWVADQVICLDWHDGPRDGFCRMIVPSVELVFHLLAERLRRDGLDDRLFSVELLPSGTIAEMIQSFASVGNTRVWTPQFRGTAEEAIADAAIAKAMSLARPTDIVFKTNNFDVFDGVWTATRRDGVVDWFREFGIG
jgi:hypothetical protein